MDDRMFAPLDADEMTAGNTRAADDWRPILPVPADAGEPNRKTLTDFAPAGYSTSHGWRYLDAAGRLLGFVVRYDRPANGQAADKQIRPLTYCEGPNGRKEWRCKAFSDPRPLYGLDRLAARPDAPVIVVEGEKTADAADKLFADHVAATSPGGSNAARKADWSPLAGRHVVIWPDADEPGAKFASDVADAVMKAGAASVGVVNVPADLPQGWDLADDVPDRMDDGELRRILGSAKPLEADGPMPLYPPLPPASPYPVNDLGPFLAEAAIAIANKVQVPFEIAAQSVLAAAALAVQAHADVRLPYGQTRPTSLSFVTIAASGDRKSSADNEALWPIRHREKALRELHDAEMKEWRIDLAAWHASKKKIEAEGKIDHDMRRDKLASLGEEPAKPMAPILTTGDVTPDGLTKNWPWMQGALGIFSAEGGQFTSGHGMTDDNRLRTAAMLSELWDGKPIVRVRAGDGLSILQGRRLSVHLMVQPDAAAGFLADGTLRDQGLLSRLLVAAPLSIAGTRFYRAPHPEDEATIKAYGARLLSILEQKPTLIADRPNELLPRVLTIDAKASAAWTAFLNHVESQCGANGDLRPILDFASKAAEHAARLAAVIAVVEDPHSMEVGIEAMRCGITLADWHIEEALRLSRAARTDPKLLKAQALLDWLHSRGEREVGFRELIQFGPGSIRTKAAGEEAVSILISHGWLKEISARPRRFKIAFLPEATR